MSERDIPGPSSERLRRAMRVLGLVGLLILFGFAATALLLTEVGTTGRAVCLAGAGFGGVLVVAYLVISGRDVVAFFTSRQFVYGGNVVLMLAMAAGIVVFVNLIGSRFYASADWTRAGSFTLSSETENLVAALPEDVQIVTFFGEDQDFRRLHDLLARYKRLSEKVKTQFVDMSDPAAVEPAAKKYGVTERDVVVLDYKGKKKILHRYEIFTTQGPPPMYPGQPPPREIFKGEDALTSAIRTLVEEEPPVIMFTTGFGEPGIDAYREPSGFARIAEEVRSSNMTCQSLAMFGLKAIPDTCDVLVVAAPTRPYGAAEAKAIRSFLEDRDGRAIFLLEPYLDQSSDRPRITLTGLEDLMSHFGAEVGRTWVVDPPQRVLMRNILVFLAQGPSYEAHPITDALEGTTTVWATTRSLAEATETTGLRVAPLIRTSGQGWAEGDLRDLEDGSIQLDEGVDVKGPITIAMAISRQPYGPSQEEPEGMRLVVFGDGTFVSNAEWDPRTANRDLFINALRWLTGRSASMGIAPKEVDEAFFSVSSRQSIFVWISTIGLALLAVAAGVVVWIIRR